MSSTVEAGLHRQLALLAEPHLKERAERLTVTRLTGDASTRAYFRVQSDDGSLVVALYSEGFDEAERASERLARLAALDPSSRLTFANDPCAHIEVTRLFSDSGLAVPRILTASGSTRALLLEDVGDVRLQDWLDDRKQDERMDEYRRAVRMIVTIQDATPVALGSNSICSCLAFDEMKLNWELTFFFANYFNHYLGMELDVETNQAVQEEFRTLCLELASRPRVLVHRDYHARNLMVHRGELVIIDHQDARMGPPSYDLASLVKDPYTAIDPDAAKELVEYFIELKAVASIPLDDVEEFRDEMELMTIQRMLKAIGTYSYQAAVAKNPTYVSYIKPAIDAALRSTEAIDRFERIHLLLEQTRGLKAATD